MGNSTKYAKLVGLAALTATTLGICVSAAASPVPPTASSTLVGTWVNTDTATRSVKQIVIQPSKAGNVVVDAFGACTPTLCEWGRVPAIVYGTDVSAATGTAFQTDQRFLSGGSEWSRTALFGSVAETKAGLRLTVRELTIFEDGSGRHNYTTTETFQPGEGTSPTVNGNSVASYPLGAPPVLNPGVFGTWKPAGTSNNLAKVVIGGSGAAPTVHAYGACSPTPCDWGTVRGITYGGTISTPRGTTELAPYTFSFKKTQLLLKYAIAADDTETLTVVAYNEFTDGSHRSNYTTTQTLVRA